ncbi:MAG: NADH-quinone oxidoreductase subunit NuoN [Helicobacteraceae bacterium]|jgi:NADH-quinone oxidoreductase subunit N|nr:NADH-quinone oxidoreductase subunit NuoN [Helicobacteraceae bacterium]
MDLHAFVSLLPMAILVVGGIVVLGVDLFVKNAGRNAFAGIAIATLVASIVALLCVEFQERSFFDALLIDGLAKVSMLVIIGASLLFMPLAFAGIRFLEYQFAEFYALFLFMAAGFAGMVSSDNLIVIVICLEIGSLALYALISMHRRDKALEAALKYFVMGALAVGLLAFGVMLLYAATGSVEIGKIQSALVAEGFNNNALVLAASAFIVAGLGFKLSVVPFHTWTPDVYEGSSAPMAGYMSIVPKIAGFAVAMRLFDFLAHNPDQIVYGLLYLAAVITLTIGNLLALVQDDVKRMLAYSSISHAGFVMTAFVMGTSEAHAGLFLYWTLFLFTNLGAFAMLWISRHPSKTWDIRFDHPYGKFSGMVRLSPMGAVIMGVFMLSLAGIPPFALFFGKIYLIGEAIASDHLYLAFIMLINSAIAVYYYLKLIVYMFLKDPADNDGTVYYQNGTTALKVVLGVAAAMTIGAFFWIEPILEFLSASLAAGGY